MSRDVVRARALSYQTPLVEITGGEPLLQPGSSPLMSELCDAGRTVLLETSGEADISSVDPRVHKIMDVKCPGSGQCHRNRWGNLSFIRASDELKFVLAGIDDYKWMRETIRERNLIDRTPHLLASVVFGQLALRDLAEWVLRDAVPVRVQVQLHKVIWGPEATGV
jgi:7-carboxy-7-deazaguanine synthase